MKRFNISIFMAVLLTSSVSVAYAQDYEDDIYYNPDKAKKTTTVKNTAKSTPISTPHSYGSYQAADTYTPSANSPRNISVDDYNRRGMFANDSVAAVSGDNENFTYTRRIEQFYNPDVVTSSSDPDLAQYYYSEPAANVNIIVNTPSYWGYPYYGRAWAWGNPYYSPLYWSAWDPWYFGPSWGWSWSWGWSYPVRPGWAWGPSWNWGWAGTARPNRPIGNVRPGYSRPGAGNARPGYGTGTYRPGNNSGPGAYRPGTGNSRPSTGTYRPGNNSNNSNNTYRPSYRPGNSNSNSGSYRPSSGGGSYRGGGSTGGGSYRGGGGGGRGRH